MNTDNTKSGGAMNRITIVKKMRDMLGGDLGQALRVVEAMEKNDVKDFSFLKEIPAFPSLRQWYAGMALQGMLANPAYHDLITRLMSASEPQEMWDVEVLAMCTGEIANAMIAEGGE